MKIVLFGSTDLTYLIANYLYKNSYEISAIVTVPPVFNISYKADGVKNARFTNMGGWGEERNIPVFQYENTKKIIADLNDIDTDFAIVAGWYHMVPKKLRDVFPLGCAGFHASLLPQLRGGAPLNWSILLGHKETGVSFFELSDGVDDGLLYAQENFSINPHDYIKDLIEKSNEAILNILQETLHKFQKGTHKKYRQKGEASYCGQRIPEDSLIDWNKSAEEILLLIRASSKPYTGAYSFLDQDKITIWEAEINTTEIYGSPGQILVVNNNICVVCGVRSLNLKKFDSKTDLSKANHKRMSTKVSSI